jgi:adenine-specific DNA-methyltransferase
MIGTDLLEFATEQQRLFDAATSAAERKERGHFGTPAAIAKFMAGMFSSTSQEVLRILDPGAGVGTLSVGVCQCVLKQETSRHLEFELWETDPNIELHLRRTMDHCRKVLRQAGHRMEYTIRTEDFILQNCQKTLFQVGAAPSFHLAILNPPYYKVRKESAQARAMAHVVYGQPNIYVFFLAVAADLLLPGGEMVAITPRSYFNGPYFKRFRKWFFDRMMARQIHVFKSRTDAFREDEVLQENVILLAEKGGSTKDVLLTSSLGRDFHPVARCSVPYNQAIDDSNGDHIIRVTTNNFEREIVETLENLPDRFRSLGLEISTGPVVTFRSTAFLRKERSNDTAPLLWMHNVRPFLIRFPPKNGKPAHIAVSADSMRLLVPARRYILLKRFTTKEEKRRLVAGIMETADSYSPWVGMENHLNYVYRPKSELTQAEAFGLAAYFNSALVDRYFRAISGNTQVNATEIRVMPVPDGPTLARVGGEVQHANERGHRAVERIVGQAMCLPPHLIEQLCEDLP